MSKKQSALPIKDVMGALDRKDREFYNRLSDDQKKDFGAWILLRYASSVQGQSAPQFIYMVNECVNKDFYAINKHPELQWLLFTTCGNKKIQYHQYIKPPTARKKKNKVQDFVASLYPHLKSDEIDLFLSINNNNELTELAKANGYADKDIEKIFSK